MRVLLAVQKKISMRKIFTPKYLLLLFCSAFLTQQSIGQTTIFSENTGTPSGTTSISSYAAGTAPATFQNTATLTYGNGGVAAPADVRATNASATYTGASGGGNIFFTSTAGSYGFSIEAINAAGLTGLQLQFGYRKESASAHAAFSVEYWDGTAWQVIANTSPALFNEAVSAGIGWYLSKPLSLPVAAQISGLKLRFVKSGSASIRVDDIKLTGQIATPVVTSISPNTVVAGSPNITLTVNGTGFLNNNSTVTFNGVAKTTTFVSATQLTAAISSADLSAAGTFPVGVTTTGAAALSNTKDFTVTAATTGTFTLVSPVSDFGNICINTTSATNSFSLDGNNLDGSSISIGTLAGFTYAETSNGAFANTLTFTYTGSSFAGKIIYVKFNPTAVQAYDGNIILNGGGVINYPVAVTGTGINDAPFVATQPASSVGSTTATFNGLITSAGCAPVTSYGFEYSTATGFPNGTGTLVSSANFAGGNFSAIVTGLLPNTRYYYKAFASNNIGTTYGAQVAFTNTPLPVVISAEPGLSYTQTFTDVNTWGSFFTSGNGANHFGGLPANASGTIPDGMKTTASTTNFNGNTFTSSGGIHRYVDSATPVQSIIFLSTGSPDNTTAAALDFYMDFTGLNAGTLSFDYATINNSTGNRNGSFRVYATVDGISFTEISFAGILNFTNNSPISGSKTNIALPAIFNNSATARLRFYYHNGSGNTGSGSRPKISIDNLTVTGVATTPCAQPSAGATNLVFGAITDTTIAASFTAANPATDNYIIVMSSNSSLTGNPANGQIYNIGDNLGDGTVVAKGSGTSFTATGLSPLSTYYFFVFPVNSICTGGPLYYTANVLNGSASTVAGLPVCAAPSGQPANLTFGTATTSSIQASFTGTTASEYLVVRSSSATLTANPANGQAYNAGDVFGNATVIQRSAATSFTAGGLQPNTTYYFFIFAGNAQACVSGPAYNSGTPLSAPQSTLPLPPCATPGSQPNTLAFTAANNAVAGTFSAATGADDYLVLSSTSASLSALPADNTDYNSGDVFGNAVVVSNSSATNFLLTNLNAGTQYYFFVFAANKTCAGGTKYLTTAPLTGNVATSSIAANNYYFGNLHAHSDYSDGNQDMPGATPADDYNYALSSQCMDYLGISEHNHFSTVDNPGNTVDNYHLGTAQANSFNSSHPNFIALYGMEWGVISNGGHVIIYGDGMDNLFGWESGGGGWGPSNNYDVYVPKSVYTGSTGLFKTVNDNIATNTFATLAHPNQNDYNNIGSSAAYDAAADSAITGMALESGPSSSTNTSYSNPGSSMSYLPYYQTMLAKGYHLGANVDHDNHKTTFGRTTYARTAIVAPALTKTALISGMRNMHFYATEDCDSKVDFSINTRQMGSIFSDRFSPNIYVTLTDATTPVSAAVIRVMFGKPGSGVPAVKIDSAIGSSLKFADNNLANLATGYYYIDITNGASRIITSPIWYTRNDLNAPLPVLLNEFTAQKEENSVLLKWTTAQEINSSRFVVEKSRDGRTWRDIGSVNAAGNSTSISNYNFYDNAPFSGVNYYRLKQIDRDGRFVYSSVKTVLFTKNIEVRITPNPAVDFVTIDIAKKSLEKSDIIISDVNGKIIDRFATAEQQKHIDLAAYTKGIYFIKTITDKSVNTQKIVVQ